MSFFRNDDDKKKGTKEHAEKTKDDLIKEIDYPWGKVPLLREGDRDPEETDQERIDKLSVDIAFIKKKVMDNVKMNSPRKTFDMENKETKKLFDQKAKQLHINDNPKERNLFDTLEQLEKTKQELIDRRNRDKTEQKKPR